MNNNKVYTAAQFNNIKGTENIRPRSGQGTYRKTGYVIYDGSTAQWARSRKEADEIAATELDGTDRVSMNNVDAMNN